MSSPEAKEPQNQSQVDAYLERGPAKMGPWTTHIWRNDPRHIGFLLARYKVVAKMLSGKGPVLEVGCGDAFGTPVVLQEVASVHGIDFEPVVLEDARERFAAEGDDRATFAIHDMLEGPTEQRFDAAFALDVIEHIPPDREGDFIANIAGSLKPDGICILGTPNIAAEKYASEASREGHVNLKSPQALRESLAPHFQNVFSFGMNDEVLHTGYHAMCHYILAMGVGLKA